MKTFEQHNNVNIYYSILWLNTKTKEFDGDPEGRYSTFGEVMEYLVDCGIHSDAYNVDFKIVKLDETEIPKEDVVLWLEAKKYNL